MSKKEFTIDENEDTKTILNKYWNYLGERSYHHLGYPYNLKFNHQELSPFLEYLINNLGDPFIESNYAVHSRPFEVKVLEFFAELWEIEKEDYWGYVTCSGTEGNLYGLILAREVLPNATLFASCESHYSVFKAAKFYRISFEKIDTKYTGEMDYGHLEESLRLHRETSKQQPATAIVSVNIGTTVKGGIDHLDRLIAILERCGYSENEYYIHCDGALFACILPFLTGRNENDLDSEQNTSCVPKVSFQKNIHSVSVSGHKFMGASMPCGVVLTRKSLMKKLEKRIDYINSVDTTIMGSRNGQAPLSMWYQIRMRGKGGFENDAKLCIQNAQYLYQQLKKNGISAMLNDFSNTVVFEKPENETVKKWQLACTGEVSHIIVMQNVSIKKLDEFIEDALKDYNKKQRKCVKQYIGEVNCLCKDCVC